MKSICTLYLTLNDLESSKQGRLTYIFPWYINLDVTCAAYSNKAGLDYGITVCGVCDLL